MRVPAVPRVNEIPLRLRPPAAHFFQAKLWLLQQCESGVTIIDPFLALWRV
jgi:hypothetical protein